MSQPPSNKKKMCSTDSGAHGGKKVRTPITILCVLLETCVINLNKNRFWVDRNFLYFYNTTIFISYFYYNTTIVMLLKRLVILFYMFFFVANLFTVVLFFFFFAGGVK